MGITAKIVAAESPSDDLHISTAPTTTEEQDLTSKPSRKARPKIGSHIPDRWPYFLERLWEQDTSWRRVTIGACVKLAQSTSIDAVSTALSFAAVDPPTLSGSAFGWLQATSRGLHEAASA